MFCHCSLCVGRTRDAAYRGATLMLHSATRGIGMDTTAVRKASSLGISLANSNGTGKEHTRNEERLFHTFFLPKKSSDKASQFLKRFHTFSFSPIPPC